MSEFRGVCWSKRGKVWYNPEVQKKHLINEIEANKIRGRSRLIKNYNNYTNDHLISEEIETN